MLPKEPLHLSELFGLAVRKLTPTMRVTVPLIFLMVLVKDFSTYMNIVPSNTTASIIYMVVSAALFVYFWAVSLRMTASVWQGDFFKLGRAFKNSLYPTLHVYAAIVVYMVVAIALFYLGYLVTHLLGHTALGGKNVALLVFFFITAFPYFFFAVLCLLTYPIIVLQKTPVWKAFLSAVKLTGKSHWLWSLAIYAVFAIMYFLITPTTLHAHFLRRYYLSAPFDFIIMLFLVPLLNNLFVLVLNNMQLDQKAQR